MDRVRLLPVDLPPKFYRVQLPENFNLIGHKGNLSAQNTATFHLGEASFGQSIVGAFTWPSRTPSPYINVFSK